ncbi:MAG: hypothetical protein ABW221_06345 [Vicinamibacteria bacterium]
MTRASLLRTAAAVALCVAATEGALSLASLARPRLTIDVGPATGPYGAGLSPSVDFPPVTARWVRSDARIALPLDVAAGSGRVLVHLAVGAQAAAPVPFELRLGAGPAARFDVGPGSAARQTPLPGRAANDPLRDTRLYGLPLATARVPLTIEIAAAPALAVDWIRLEGFRYRVPARAIAIRLIAPGLLALALVLGLALRRALALALAGAALAAGCVAVDPFLAVHVAAKVFVPGLVLALAAAAVLRRRTWAPALVLVLLAGFVLKGALVFHPGLHAPDALLHTRFVAAFRAARGDLADRGRAAQRAAFVGSPRFVAGRAYAMPYSAAFYLPFVPLPEARVTGAMKYAVVLASVLQTALVFALARALTGRDGVALAAALLHTLSPPPFHRLIWAMWPATAGHLADLVALAALFAWLREPESRRRFAWLAAAVLLSFGTYVSGVVLVGALVIAAALVARQHALRLLALGAAAGGLAIAIAYRPFAFDFVREILPAVWTTGARAVADAGASPWTPLARIPLFYGWAYPLVAAAGLWLVSRGPRTPERRWFHAYALAFALALALRGLSGVVLRDLKDALFAAPLLALLATIALARLADRGRQARRVAIGVGIGLGLHGLAMAWSYLTPRLALAAPG